MWCRVFSSFLLSFFGGQPSERVVGLGGTILAVTPSNRKNRETLRRKSALLRKTCLSRASSTAVCNGSRLLFELLGFAYFTRLLEYRCEHFGCFTHVRVRRTKQACSDRQSLTQYGLCLVESAFVSQYATEFVER